MRKILVQFFFNFDLTFKIWSLKTMYTAMCFSLPLFQKFSPEADIEVILFEKGLKIANNRLFARLNSLLLPLFAFFVNQITAVWSEGSTDFYFIQFIWLVNKILEQDGRLAPAYFSPNYEFFYHFL